jgi:hypothetical protein
MKKPMSSSTRELIYGTGGLILTLTPIGTLLLLAPFLQTSATDVQRWLIISLGVGASLGLGGSTYLLFELHETKAALRTKNSHLRNMPMLVRALFFVYQAILNEQKAPKMPPDSSIDAKEVLDKIIELFAQYGPDQTFKLAANDKLLQEIASLPPWSDKLQDMLRTAATGELA